MPLRALCECNQTQINYFTEEPDLDNWKRSDIDIDSENSRMYLVPNIFLKYCDSYENIQIFLVVERHRVVSAIAKVLMNRGETQKFVLLQILP